MIKVDGKTAALLIGGITGIVLLELGISDLVDKLSRYDKDGFDKNGFTREGYDKTGYSRAGFDRHGFDKEGFNSSGYNSLGYNREGYNKQGYDAEGFNALGIDKSGWDHSGFDREGYDRCGRDAEGYDRSGFARDGFNRNGYDWEGYGRDKYNSTGVDRVGNTRQNYTDSLVRLHGLQGVAYRKLKSGEYEYALFEARRILEEILKLVVGHSIGTDRLGDGILENLKICERKKLLGEDDAFIDKLHSVRKICNTNIHKLSYAENITHNQVHFVVVQIRDLLDISRDYLLAV